jgi:hypothetical protein
VTSGFVQAIFSESEIKSIERLYQCFEKWRGVYSVKLRAISNSKSHLQSIVQEAAEKYLDNESITFLKLSRNNHIGSSSERYFTERGIVHDHERSEFIKDLLIEFYHGFDPFCTKFFKHMETIELDFDPSRTVEMSKIKSNRGSPTRQFNS